MLEFLIILGTALLVGAIVLGGLFKLAVCVILLPLKLAVWTFKGLLALIFLIPALVLGAVCFALVFPLVAVVLALPVMAVLGIIALVAWVF